MIKLFSYSVIILVLLTGCKPTHPDQQLAAAKEVVSNHRVAFLSFNIAADSSGKSRVELISKTIKDGKMKAGGENITPANHLIIALLDRDKHILQTEVIEHPLYREVEYIGDGKEFKRKTLHVSQADFFVRINFVPDAEWVTVTEVIDQKVLNSFEFQMTPK